MFCSSAKFLHIIRSALNSLLPDDTSKQSCDSRLLRTVNKRMLTRQGYPQELWTQSPVAQALWFHPQLWLERFGQEEMLWIFPLSSPRTGNHQLKRCQTSVRIIMWTPANLIPSDAFGAQCCSALNLYILVFDQNNLKLELMKTKVIEPMRCKQNYGALMP